MTALESQEEKIINTLAEAWNEFVKLKVLHPSDNNEFMAAIHVAQNIIMARPVLREMYSQDKTMEKI